MHIHAHAHYLQSLHMCAKTHEKMFLVALLKRQKAHKELN